MERNCRPYFVSSKKTPTNGSTKSELPFTTQFSDPHFDLSAYTFARDTIPFNNISFALDLLTHDDAATQNLLTLDRVNQAIIGLERQLDEHRLLATRHFSSLLQRHSAQHFPQRFHEYLYPNCGRCHLRRRRPTPFTSPIPPSSFSSSSSSPPSRHQHSPSYQPQSQRASRNYSAERLRDCLQRLQTIPEERQRGTREFPIVVEDPEAEDDVFVHYYHWFINEGRD